MKRFFITLSYNGKNYVGWQIQPNGVSVQQVLQEALSTILREQTDVVGAGRTDAGVHARRMTAHFDFSGESFHEKDLVKNLNSFLPRDIAVHQIREVQPDAHARFSATSRTYKYYLTTEKDPFFHDFSYQVFFRPDIGKMNALCEALKEYTDFTSFSKLHTDVKTNNCRVSEAYWEQESNTRFVFTITADRFLRNMVRAIVGTLLEAGRGRLDERGLRRIIEAKDRRVAGDSAPGHALFLHDVVYPDNIWL
ncbi:MAG: tRNA pseudouridine(38-40) synthase TruA [Bacteroidia bacterium]|nr:tRNA pseudouridine(38-40) synthase TruA [Bacteroidia bacterium]